LTTKEKPESKWQLVKDVTVRVLLDLWVPAVIALGIEAYKSFQHWAGWLPTLGAFFTTMFFTGAYVNWVQRAKKFVIDQRNHSNVLSKQDALIDHLHKLTNDLSDRQNVVLNSFEALRDDLEGLTTGGPGFAYVWFVRTTDTTVIELDVMVEGKFPLHEVHLGVTNLTSMREKLEQMRRTGDPYVAMTRDLNHAPGTLIPNLTYPVRCTLPITENNKIRLHLNWQAKNGTWYQRIQLEKIDSEWKMATFIKRGEDVIYSKTDDGYPRNESGEPIFQEYDIN
jgi:hypothetical protein